MKIQTQTLLGYFLDPDDHYACYDRILSAYGRLKELGVRMFIFTNEGMPIALYISPSSARYCDELLKMADWKPYSPRGYLPLTEL